MKTKRAFLRLLCLLGFHFKSLYKWPYWPQTSGLDNCGFRGYRVDYYKCPFCKKEIHWSVKVNY